MIDLQVRFEVDGEPASPELLDDQYELAAMLEHTEAQIRQQVTHKLAGLRCPDHDRAPQVIVTGAYISDLDQMELSYHVDTCCQPFLLRTVAALNR